MTRWDEAGLRRDAESADGRVATVARGPDKKHSEPNRVEHHCFMKPLSRHHRRELASPLNHTAIQNLHTKIPSNKMALDASHRNRASQRGIEECFFLTSSLIG